MKNLLLAMITVLAFLFYSGCMGTFETARVVPLKVGATLFKTIDSQDDDSFIIPGVIIETGWPAGPGRFGLGLHLRVSELIASSAEGDNDFLMVWGGKVQMPQNDIADLALGVDIWGFLPGEIKFFISRRFGIVEPYACLAVADIIDYNDSEVLSSEGLVSYTMGTMIELGKGSGWMIAAEIEGGEVWISPGVGAGLIKEF